jgi:hypothetical protein
MDEDYEAGSAAFLAGIGQLQNPHYPFSKMPAQTQEPFERWQQKVAAWDKGWTASERARRVLTSRLRAFKYTD